MNFLESLAEGHQRSSRMAEEYKWNLFPDKSKLEYLLMELAEQDIVDIGCGLTHADPYSLMNRVAHVRKESDAEGSFVGFDDRIREDKSLRYFSWIQQLTMHSMNAIRRIAEMQTGLEPSCSLHGMHDGRHGSAQKLPGIENESVDTVLSHWCFPAYFSTKDYRAAMQEILRVLKPGGQARLYPVRPAEYKVFTSDMHSVGKLIRHNFDMVFRTPIPMIPSHLILRPHQTVILTKHK